jgi:glucose-6-phosphate dehydrogenase assembly protein OpcA
MAAVVVDHVWRESSPTGLDADLAALWRDLAPVTRALMSNLIVFSESATPKATIDLGDVVRRHPSRVILLRHSRQSHACAPVAVRVGAMVFGSAGAKYAIEQIAVESACSDQSLLSILRRLMLGDLPTSVLWLEDFASSPPIAPIVGMARQLVYDSRQWRDVRAAVSALAPMAGGRVAPAFADINWRRLTSLRNALVHALESARDGDELRGVEIRHRPGDAALAWLLVGWLDACVKRESRVPIHVEETGAGPLVSVTLRVGPGVTATLTNAQVRVEDGSGRPPFVLAVPQESEADAVAAELHSLRHDACLRDALSALVHRFSAT